MFNTAMKQNRSTKAENLHVSTGGSNTLLGAVRFHSSEAHKVAHEFREHFKVSFPQFFEGFWHLQPIVLIDIFKFEKWLKDAHGYKDEISLSDFVLTNFGQSAHEFLKRLI